MEKTKWAQIRKTPEVLDSVARAESLHFDRTMVVCAATAVNLETIVNLELSTWKQLSIVLKIVNCQPGNRSIVLKTAFSPSNERRDFCNYLRYHQHRTTEFLKRCVSSNFDIFSSQQRKFSKTWHNSSLDSEQAKAKNSSLALFVGLLLAVPGPLLAALVHQLHHLGEVNLSHLHLLTQPLQHLGKRR